MKCASYGLAVPALAVALLMSGPILAQSGFTVAFADALWNGQTVPEGQQCSPQGGTGATPALEISGLPPETTTIHVAFNDESFPPMDNGGHGIIGFEVAPVDGAVTLPSVPGETEDFPEGAFLAAPNATMGSFLTAGYMPPCSGGRGNQYSMDVTALDSDGNALDSVYLPLGTY